MTRATSRVNNCDTTWLMTTRTGREAEKNEKEVGTRRQGSQDDGAYDTGGTLDLVVQKTTNARQKHRHAIFCWRLRGNYQTRTVAAEGQGGPRVKIGSGSAYAIMKRSSLGPTGMIFLIADSLPTDPILILVATQVSERNIATSCLAPEVKL